VLLLQQLAGHHHALDLVGALVDLGDPGSALPGQRRACLITPLPMTGYARRMRAASAAFGVICAGYADI
jgi:hypothetical protein